MVSNHIHFNVWDEIIYQFSNFNGTAVQVWEWLSNLITYFPEFKVILDCKIGSWSFDFILCRFIWWYKPVNFT